LANTIKRTSYKIFMGLPEGTFKVLCDPEAEPGEGWASEGGPHAVDTGTDRKGAGDGTYSEALEKQAGMTPWRLRSLIHAPHRLQIRGLL
jgi:hypothetical protein